MHKIRLLVQKQRSVWWKEANMMKMAISEIHLDPIQDCMYIREAADSVHREVC